jgi:putative FmdB family regulatory protein
MPIYEYRCSSCGHEKDILQKMSDAPVTECPACGKSTFRKLISAAGFQLKGSGWYATDFKGGSKKPASVEDKGKSESKDDSVSKDESRSQKESKAKEESKSTQESKGGAPASGGGASAA